MGAKGKKEEANEEIEGLEEEEDAEEEEEEEAGADGENDAAAEEEAPRKSYKKMIARGTIGHVFDEEDEEWIQVQEDVRGSQGETAGHSDQTIQEGVQTSIAVEQNRESTFWKDSQEGHP